MAVVFKKKSDGNPKEIGRTEVIKNSCDPNWIENVFTYHQYYFKQPILVFRVYGVGRKYIGLPANKLKLDEQNIIGEASRCLSTAISTVGEVIKPFDFDKRFSAWGFGGKPTGDVVSHCFNLNGSPGETEVAGVDGILSAYSGSLHRITLGNHAAFGEVITKAAEVASQSMLDTYSVLVIITAGVLADIQETTDALVSASACPLSIVIVGVGDADFENMQILENTIVIL